MSVLKRAVLLFLALVCFLVAAVYFSRAAGPKTYSGWFIGELVVAQGWYLELESESAAAIQAADSEYFSLEYSDQVLEGVRAPRPLDYPADNYFYLEGQLDPGKWLVSEGDSVSFKLTSEKQMEVKISSTQSIIVDRLVNAILLFLGLAIMSLAPAYLWLR